MTLDTEKLITDGRHFGTLTLVNLSSETELEPWKLLAAFSKTQFAII